MKYKEFATIGKKLLPHLPGFVIKGPMTFKSPVGDILYVLHFDGSSFDAKGFYLEIFFMPLYVPSDFVHFLFGKRLGGGGNRLEGDAPNLMTELIQGVEEEAVPFFEKVSTMHGIVESLSSG